MKIKKIVMVELDSTFLNLGLLMGMPRFGITVIGSVLDGAGYDVKVLIDSYIKVTLKKILKENPDCIMFNGIRPAIDRIRDLANKIKKRRPKIPIIIGGEEATMYSDNVKDFADYIVLNEGDETILKLLDAIKGKRKLSGIDGIWYKNKGKWIKTKMAERVKNIDYHLNPSIFVGFKDIARKFLSKRYNISRKGRWLSFPIQTSRACIYRCPFCTQQMLFGKSGYILRDMDDVISDIDKVMEYSGIKHFLFVDNLFGADKEYTIKFLKKLINHYKDKEDKPEFTAFMRADQFYPKNKRFNFTDKELDLMSKAGMVQASIGMESVNEKTLKKVKQGATLKVYINAIKRLKKHNIKTIGTFGMGGGEDSKRHITGVLKFGKLYGIDHINLYTYTILPGTPEYKISRHLIIENVPHIYMNGHSMAMLPRKILPSEAQEEVFNAMNTFYLKRGVEGLFFKFYLRKIRKSLKPYTKRLKKLEKQLKKEKLYIKNKQTGDWELQENLLEGYTVDYHKGVIKNKAMDVQKYTKC